MIPMALPMASASTGTGATTYALRTGLSEAYLFANEVAEAAYVYSSVNLSAWSSSVASATRTLSYRYGNQILYNTTGSAIYMQNLINPRNFEP